MSSAPKPKSSELYIFPFRGIFRHTQRESYFPNLPTVSKSGKPICLRTS